MAPYSMPFRTQLYINSSFTLNLKAAVTRHTKDGLLLNAVFSDLEDCYDTIVLPPPAYKPKGKPTVEKYVDYLETWLLEELKKETYFSFEAINVKARQIIDSLNDQISKGYDLSRREMFEKYDKPQMMRSAIASTDTPSLARCISPNKEPLITTAIQSG